MTLLAFAAIGPDDDWGAASAPRLGLHGVIQFAAAAYGKHYAENTRETIRRQVIHQLVEAGILALNPDAPALATNSPLTHYALTDEALLVVRRFEAADFDAEVEAFRTAAGGGLADRYRRERQLARVPVRSPDGQEIILSPGPHNQLERAVVEEFLSRFAPDAMLLYLADAEAKDRYLAADKLEELGVPAGVHGKLPDVVALDQRRMWLFLCEAVTSHGPVSPKRHSELELALADCLVPRVYVSAFPTFAEYKRYAESISWETEVWIAEAPSHLLHYDGERFIAAAR